MKFKDFLREGTFSPSIDDNLIIQTLDFIGIQYVRTKNENGSLLYDFDNRYSMKYDSNNILTLYRHGNKINYSNGRNLKEIENAIALWQQSYRLSDSEESDEISDEIIDKHESDEDNNDDSSNDDSNQNDFEDENGDVSDDDENETDDDPEEDEKDKEEK